MAHVCEPSVLCLLLRSQSAARRQRICPKTHAGVRTLFNKHFVRPGVIPQEPAALYNALFDYRHKSDYDVFFEPEPARLLSWIPETEAFINTIFDRIENH